MVTNLNSRKINNHFKTIYNFMFNQRISRSLCIILWSFINRQFFSQLFLLITNLFENYSLLPAKLLSIYIHLFPSSPTGDPIGSVAHVGLGFSGNCANFPKLPATFTEHCDGPDVARVPRKVGKCLLISKSTFNYIFYYDYNNDIFNNFVYYKLYLLLLLFSIFHLIIWNYKPSIHLYEYCKAFFW